MSGVAAFRGLVGSAQCSIASIAFSSIWMFAYAPSACRRASEASRLLSRCLARLSIRAWLMSCIWSSFGEGSGGVHAAAPPHLCGKLARLHFTQASCEPDTAP